MTFSKIIAGTMTWGSWGKKFTKMEMADLINHCLEAGISSFDHADIYGAYSTESDFGQAFLESGIAREDIQFISKCGIQLETEHRNNFIKHYQYDAEYIVSSAENSLRQLKTEYLDLLLLHRPSPLMEPEEISKAFDLLKAEGKVKQFGVSNFSPSQMELVRKHTDISVNQIEFSLTEHSAMYDGNLDYMRNHEMHVMAWSPLGTVFRENTEQSKRIHRELGAMSKTYGATEDQLLLAWILRHPSNITPVIGTTDKTRISNAVKALEINLGLQDWFKILQASQGHEVP